VERQIQNLLDEEIFCEGFFSNRKRPKEMNFSRPKHKKEDHGPKSHFGDEQFFRPLTEYHLKLLISKYPQFHPHNLKDMGHSHQDLFVDSRTGEIVVRAKNRNGESEAVGIKFSDLFK
jgi:hypothetical protein